MREGVTIVGFTNLPSMMSFHASQLYSRNVALAAAAPRTRRRAALDFDDEITAGACVAGRPESRRAGPPAEDRSRRTRGGIA